MLLAAQMWGLSAESGDNLVAIAPGVGQLAYLAPADDTSTKFQITISIHS